STKKQKNRKYWVATKFLVAELLYVIKVKNHLENQLVKGRNFHHGWQVGLGGWFNLTQDIYLSHAQDLQLNACGYILKVVILVIISKHAVLTTSIDKGSLIVSKSIVIFLTGCLLCLLINVVLVNCKLISYLSDRLIANCSKN
ncbi:hypothetical protein ACJX0J_011557, partial [Zea mays]